MIYDIEKNLENIVSEISQKNSDFKVLTKVKNEIHLLPLWLEHMKSMGFKEKDIVIFDNYSDNEEFINILNDCSDKITVIRHSYNMDAVHVPSLLQDIYMAVCNSSDFFTFIDVDEFIYKFQLDTKDISIPSKQEMVEKLLALKDFDCFSLPWVQVNDMDFSSIGKIYKMFDFGKVIVNSKNFLEKFQTIDTSGTIMHLRHIAFFYRELKIYPRFTEFFVLHNKFISPERVLDINKRKIDLKLNLLGLSKSFDEIIENKSDILDQLKKEDFRTCWFLSYNLEEIELAEKIIKGQKAPSNDKKLSDEEVENLENFMNFDFYGNLPNISYSEYFYLVEKLSETKKCLIYGDGCIVPLAIKLGVRDIIVSLDKFEYYKYLSELSDKLLKSHVYSNARVYINYNDNDYLLWPWYEMSKHQIDTDLVFINGEKGLQSLITSILLAKTGTTIILKKDDLSEFHYIFKIQKYIEDFYAIDNFLIFEKKKIKEEALTKLLFKFYNI